MDLEAFVQARNADKTSDALLKGVMGGLATLLACGLCFTVASFLAVTWSWPRLSHAPAVALAITGLYLAVAFASAWRRVDPLRALTPPSAQDAARRQAIEGIFPGRGYQFENALRRETIAGLAAVLLAGPARLVEALAAWRERVPVDPERVREAQALLDRMGQGGVRTDTVVDREACLLLVRLGLVKADARGEDEVVLVPSARGKPLVRG